MPNPIPTSDLFAPEELDGIFASLERKLARDAATPAAPEDPEAARRRWLSDRAELLLRSGFDREHVDRCRAEDPGQTLALDAARAFIAGTKPILLLAGGVGCGKTTAATWIAREVGGARPGRIRSTTFERRGRYDADYSAWVDERTMVVLDDLGVEPLDGKGYFSALVDELVDYAWGNRRRLVVTTNVDRPTLQNRLDPRAFSRLFDKSATVAARCGDLDLRVRR